MWNHEKVVFLPPKNEGLEIESMEEKMTLMKRKMKKTKSNSMKKIILSLLVFQMKR